MLQKADDDQELRSKALAALRAETIPLARPREVWGGRGAGDQCPVCGAAVKPSELELELQFADTGDEEPVCVLHLHVRCFSAWEMAREALVRKRGE